MSHVTGAVISALKLRRKGCCSSKYESTKAKIRLYLDNRVDTR